MTTTNYVPKRIELKVGQVWKGKKGDSLIITDDRHLFWMYRFKVAGGKKWKVFKDTDIGIKLWIRSADAYLANNNVNKIWLDLNKEVNAKS